MEKVPCVVPDGSIDTAEMYNHHRITPRVRRFHLIYSIGSHIYYGINGFEMADPIANLFVKSVSHA